MKSLFLPLIFLCILAPTSICLAASQPLSISCKELNFGNKRDPHIRLLFPEYSSTKNNFKVGDIVRGSFVVNENLRILKSHFDSKPILPGVYFPHLALKLIDKAHPPTLRNDSHVLKQTIEFTNKNPATPGDRVLLQMEVERVEQKSIIWKFSAQNFQGKNYGDGRIETLKTNTHPNEIVDIRKLKSLSKKRGLELSGKKPNFSPYYTSLDTFNFLPHGYDIAFPIEILRRKTLNSTGTFVMKAANSNNPLKLNYAGSQITSLITIPKNHFMLDKPKKGDSFLPSAFIPELGAQIAITGLLDNFKSPLKYNVLLRKTSKAKFHLPLYSEQPVVAVLKIKKTSFIRSMLKIDFTISLRYYGGEKIASMDIVGLVTE